MSHKSLLQLPYTITTANLTPEDQWSCKRSPDILAYQSKTHTKPGKYMEKK